MVDFSKKNTKESGGKYADKDWTVNAAKWNEFTFNTGFTGILYEWEATDAVGNDATIQWLLGNADKLRNKVVVNDDGQLEDVDPDNPYEPRTNDPTSKLFNSMEDAGVSMKILANIGERPDGVVGYTFHLIDVPTGKKQMKKMPDGSKVETQYDQTWLIVEPGEGGIVSSPSGKKGGPKATAKPTAAVAGKKPVKKVAEPEPDEDEDEDEDEEAEVDPVEAAAVAMIQNVLSAPKKFIPTYNAKQNDGGVTTGQMRTAALGNAVPKEHRAVSKADISKMVGKPAVYTKYEGELWSFDADNGVVSALD